jgi:hypothetical protein
MIGRWLVTGAALLLFAVGLVLAAWDELRAWVWRRR